MQEHEEYTAETKPKNDFIKNTFEILESLVLAIVCVIVTFIFVARLSIVDGASMEPTLQNRDYLIVSDPFFTYNPKTGDVIVLQPTDHTPIVKRVIATEGQEVKIVYSDIYSTEGIYDVYVDGIKLDEEYTQYIFSTVTEDGRLIKLSYIPPSTSVFDSFESVGSITTATAIVPEGCVFVMGDNRNNSLDSRSRTIGFVDEDLVLGKVIFRLMPLQKIGTVK